MNGSLFGGKDLCYNPLMGGVVMLTKDQLKSMSETIQSRLLKTASHPESDMMKQFVSLAADAAVIAISEYEKITQTETDGFQER